MLVSDYLRVAANKAEVVAPLRTLGFHTFRRTLASVLVKMPRISHFPEDARFGPGQDGG